MDDVTALDAPHSFSVGEMARRRAELEAAMDAAGVEHAVLYGVDRSGTAVPWLTGWPVTREAAAVVSPGHTDVLLVQHYNHVPNARRMVANAEVRWGGTSTADAIVAELVARGGRSRVGIVGPIGHATHRVLARFASEVVDLNDAYVRLRLVKSPEEIEWLRMGARLSDAAIDALLEGAEVGHSEHDLVALIEMSYLPAGGTTHIHYLAATAMDEPDRVVPAQFPTGRRLRAGDLVTVEISAAYRGYAGQVLRTFTVGRETNDLYGRLHSTALRAFDAISRVIRDGIHAREVVEAASLIEDAGYTTVDDLVHGFGGGYLPPVLGSPSRAIRPVPDMSFEAGMTIVIQPNVVTKDGRAGVQTGELVLVTHEGVERLHAAPTGLLRIGKA